MSADELAEREVMFVEPGHVYLVWNDGSPLALAPDTQHVGDEVWYCPSSGFFESPAHGESFDGRGYYYAGPGARGLARHPVEIVDGSVIADLTIQIEGPPRGAGPALEPRGPFCSEESAGDRTSPLQSR